MPKYWTVEGREREETLYRMAPSLHGVEYVQSQEGTSSFGKKTKRGLHRAWDLREELWNEGAAKFITLHLG